MRQDWQNLVVHLSPFASGLTEEGRLINVHCTVARMALLVGTYIYAVFVPMMSRFFKHWWQYTYSTGCPSDLNFLTGGTSAFKEGFRFNDACAGIFSFKFPDAR